MSTPASRSHLKYTPSARPGEAEIIIDSRSPTSRVVGKRLFGEFCEHLRDNIYHGMEAQLLPNCTFGRWRFSASDDHPDGGVREETDPERVAEMIRSEAQALDWPDPDGLIEAYRSGGAYKWVCVGEKSEVQLSPDTGPTGGRAQRVETHRVTDSGRRAEPFNARSGIATFTYLPLHRTRRYEFTIVGRAGSPTNVSLVIRPAADSDRAVVAESVIALGSDWTKQTGDLTIPDWAPDDILYQVEIASDTPMNIVLDRCLMYPSDHVGGADPDIIRSLKEAHLPLLRWPGGNFVSGYHWRDGIGPVEKRPTMPNPAWSGLEYNLFGTDEFMKFCEEVGCEPMICINAGNGTPEEAADWVEYCNGGSDTPMGRLRAENGHPAPYGVRLWEIGNELYGRWQVHRTTSAGNLDRYQRFRKGMLERDPDIELLGCGHGNEPVSDWNRTLIRGATSNLSIITDHILTGGEVDAGTDPTELFHAFMGYGETLYDRYTQLRAEMLQHGVDKPRLAVTELQLFAKFSRHRASKSTAVGQQLVPETMPKPDTISEALYYAGIVNTLLRLDDFGWLLTHSATVNHGGGLRKERERVYPNPVYFAQSMYRETIDGALLDVTLEAPSFSTSSVFEYIPEHDSVPAIDCIAVQHKDGRIVILLVHRCLTLQSIETTVRLPGVPEGTIGQTTTLAGSAMFERNTLSDPHRISPYQSKLTVGKDSKVVLTVRPFSLVSIVLRDHETRPPFL